ncbi:coiled-coil domain-containing protein 66 isoform X2 [Rhinoraja longicauda]
MNLGDGLKLETQLLNGKPKLILAPYDVSSKETKKMKYKNRTIHPLKSKQILQVAPSHENNSKTEKPLLKPIVTNTSVAPGKGERTELAIEKKADDKTKRNCETIAKNGQPGIKTSVKKLGITKQQPPKKQKITSDELRENLVCLTQEQLQQILASVNQVNKSSNQKQERDKSIKPGKGAKETQATDELKKGDNPTSRNEVGCNNNKATRGNSSCRDSQASQTSGADVAQANIIQTENMGNKEPLSSVNQTKDGLFGNLGERENAKDQLEAKRIQWKKELDEQVALKKQLQKNNEVSEFSEWNPWGKRDAKAPVRSNTKKILETFEGKSPASSAAASGPHADGRVISTAPTVTNAANTDVPPDGIIGKASSFSLSDLPAAIRSVFVLGDYAPRDHLLGAIKRDQQKKWLQELDKQREEDQNRRLKEKLQYSEGDHHSRWAMHFDSYQRKLPQPSPVSVNVLGSILEKSPASGDGQPNVLKLQLLPAQASPLPIQPSGSAGEDAAFMNGDTVSDLSNAQKSSFLRSMTALLDPAEIEERDVRRQKQQEHQKAIAQQVEERRRLKQLEEDNKRKEAQKEEMRLAKERERLREQYEVETRTQKGKEELYNLKTNRLYEAVQKAQEEAKRQKQEQRIKDLVRKGHDVSNLQTSGEGTIYEMDPCEISSDLVCEAVDEELGLNPLEEEEEEEESPRKDRGIQTEDFWINGKAERTMHNTQIRDRGQASTTSNTATEYNEANNKLAKKKSKPAEKAPVTGKENCLQRDDLYSQFARTKKGKNENRPEWNINITSKRYVPASQRYPRGLQVEREEKKIKRQMELLQLLERNAPDQRPKKKTVTKAQSSERLPSPVVPALQAKLLLGTCSQPLEKQKPLAVRKEDPIKRINSNHKLPVDKDYRSPSIPSLRNKQLQMEPDPRTVGNPAPGECCQWAPLANEGDNDGPLSFHFVPYVRTDEVYHLDPDAPMSRPSTDDPQYKRSSVLVMDHLQCKTYSVDHPSDPLLNPDLLRNRERQQAILKSLSELRQQTGEFPP